MKILKKGDPDYHIPLNENFSELETKVLEVETNTNNTVSAIGNQTVAGIKNFKDGIQVNNMSLLDMFYPVGSIFQSTKATNPATTMGGTWTQIKGRFLVGIDAADTDFTAGKTGGVKTVEYDLGNGTAYAQLKLTSNSLDSKNVSYAAEWAVNTTNNAAMTFKSGSGMQSGGVNVVGKTDAQSNLPPYKAVYMWERTA